MGLRLRAAALAIVIPVTTVAGLLQKLPRPAQRPSQPGTDIPVLSQTSRSGGGSIAVEGCLEGSSLEPLDADPILLTYGATRYDLRLSRALQEQLRAHQGHAEKVVGTLQLPVDDERGAVSKNFDKTKTQFTASGDVAPPAGDETPVIAVKTVEHRSDKCSVMRRDPSPDRTGNTIATPGR